MKRLTKFIILLLALSMLFACGKNDVAEKEPEVKPEVKEELPPEPEKIYSPLGGSEVEEDIEGKRVWGIMIDNHPDARPQSGLNDAEIIYEFKAEGEYTRYLAMFMKDYPKIVGPVRSARPYFVDTTAEYNGLYIHWGGSDAGYAEIPKMGVDDLDGIALEGITFFRNKDVKKKRPHNGYTTDELILAQMEKRNISKTAEFKPFNFDDEVMDDAMRPCDDITLNFFPTHKMRYEYVPADGNYRIYRNDEVLVDEDYVINEKPGAEVRVDNLIVEFADSKVTGPKDTLTINHIGEGKGLLISSGRIIDIIWEKPDAASKTVFKDNVGNIITLKRGRTWISVLDPDDPIKILPSDAPEEVEAESENVETNK